MVFNIRTNKMDSEVQTNGILPSTSVEPADYFNVNS